MRKLNYRPSLENPPRNGKMFFDNITLESGVNLLSGSDLEFFESTDRDDIKALFESRVLDWVSEEKPEQKSEGESGEKSDGKAEEQAQTPKKTVKPKSNGAPS